MSAHLGPPPGDVGAARLIPCVETHTCGEPTRIVTMLDIPGSTIVEKQEFVRSHLDHVRQALIREPRGHRDMFGAILTRPVTPEAAAGVIWLDHGGYLSGCGHATIGVGIAMVETGMVIGRGSRHVLLPRLAERAPAAPGRPASGAGARDHVRERRGVHGGRGPEGRRARRGSGSPRRGLRRKLLRGARRRRRSACRCGRSRHRASWRWGSGSGRRRTAS